MPILPRPYVGRFAPSPTGPLHAGSVVAALGSWLDARAHSGRWLVRVEDVDSPRCPPGMDREILRQLAVLGLLADEAPLWQSRRNSAYAAALQDLIDAGSAYPCACSRKDLTQAQGQRPRHGELVYPGTCRPERGGLHGRPARAWRFRVRPGLVTWQDRRLGPQQQDVEQQVGDFVLRRADGLWAYQLAVVVDDGAQGVTDVVRGADLADNTPRQIQLQQALGLPTPRYLHLPLVLAADGQKLSKQNGAAAFDESRPLQALQAAARQLGLTNLPETERPADWLAAAVQAWAARETETMRGIPTDFSRLPMHTLPSGLQLDDTRTGDGAEARAGAEVQVHYTGWLWKDGAKGAKFDSSRDRNEPFEFELDGGMVIRGWDEGVQGMKVGGQRTLLIPPQLGYGARGAGGVIPPNATLCFEIELLAVSGGAEPLELTFETTATGLQFHDAEVGSGNEAQPGARVRVHYTGWLWKNGAKGRKFDSSKDRGVPFHFHLGGGEVIPGWDEGVQGMKEGGRRILVIPSELGYGPYGAGGVIPPHATLCFEVELIKA